MVRSNEKPRVKGEGGGAVGACYQGNNSESPYGEKIHWFMNHSLSVFLSECPPVSLSVSAQMKTSPTSSLEFLFWDVDVLNTDMTHMKPDTPVSLVYLHPSVICEIPEEQLRSMRNK